MSTNTDGFQDFGFDEGDDKVGKKTNRFKGKEGESYRVSFVFLNLDDDGNPDFTKKVRFTGCERHYVQGVGYFLHNGPEFSRIAGGPPKQAIATIICSWPTLKNGKLDTEQFKAGKGWEVQPWVFSADKYDKLKRRNDEFPLTECDVGLACTDTQYQKMDISACRESLFRKLWENPKGQAIAKSILAEVAEVEKTLRSDMARPLSLDKIRESMGGSNAGPVSGGGAAENVDGLLDNLLDDDDE